MPMLPEYKTILYASDLGINTKPVFRAALSIARKYEARIIMLHVVEPMSPAIQAVVDTYLTDIDAKKVQEDGMRGVLKAMRQRLENFCREELDTHDIKSAKVKELLIASGKISEEIIKTAEKYQVDMIVLGKSTRNILGNDVAGSVARRVSRYSSVPVLIVPNTLGD